MRMNELRAAYMGGQIDKKVYWTLMRENYTHILPELQEVLNNNRYCKGITIDPDGIVLEKRSGLKLYFNFTESFSRAEIDFVGTDPEEEEMKWLKNYLKREHCKTVLDIGANVGMFSLELMQSISEIECYVFEPISSTYERLLKTAKLNDVDMNVFHPYNLGVSNQEGMLEFYLPGESEAASLQPIDDEFYRKQSDTYGKYIGSNDMKKVSCEVTTLDAFVKKNSISDIDFIKIDVEGNEKFVLEGAGETLKQFKPLVYCELLRKHAKRFGYHPNDVIEYMRVFGYSCNIIKKGDILEINYIDENTEETNFIFFPQRKEV